MDIKLNQQDFQQTIANNPKILIDFYADWCGPCQTLLPTIHKLAEDYKEAVIIKKVNVDDNRELATALGIRSIPTLIYIANGKEVKRHNGLLSETDLRSQINQLKSI